MDTTNAGSTGSTSAPGSAESASAATAPAAATATASVAKSTPGESVTDKIHALHTAHFNGTPLANHTDLWNLVFEFKEKVVALVAEAYADVKAKL